MSQLPQTVRPERRRFLGEAAALALGAPLLATPLPAPAAIPPALRAGAPAAARVAVSSATTPPFSVRVLTRMGFGPRPGDIDAFDARAGGDAARLADYVDEQLHPDGIDDSPLQTKLAASDFVTLNKPLRQLWHDHANVKDDWEWRVRPVFETERAAFLRAVHSRRQLVEVLADFWHTHFSVHGRGFITGPTFVHYDRDVIRRHLLGNFGEMLEAVTQSAAMMHYLDNVSNHRNGPNENFARECLELHTLGTRNAYGFRPTGQIPAYADGLKHGYSEADVKAFTRCLTGWTIRNGLHWDPHPDDDDSGTFFFRADWHDRDPKTVLGLPVDADGIDEARQVLARLARHPNVAAFVCAKLCRRLVADRPPAALVEAAAATFLQYRDAPDQLTRVTRTILLSDAFRNTWGEKIKRPFETIASALRALDVDLSLRFDDRSDDWPDNGFWFDAQNFIWMAQQTGHFPFGWGPPNGYPDLREDWSGSTPLVMTWRVLNGVVNHWGTAAGRHLVEVLEPTLAALPSADDHTPVRLTDFWLQRLLGFVPQARREPLIAFMAQGAPADRPLDIRFDAWSKIDSEAYVTSRLRLLVAMILMLPDFLQR